MRNKWKMESVGPAHWEERSNSSLLFLKIKIKLELQFISLYDLTFLGHEFRHVPRNIDISSAQPTPFLFGQEHERITWQISSLGEDYSYVSNQSPLNGGKLTKSQLRAEASFWHHIRNYISGMDTKCHHALRFIFLRNRLHESPDSQLANLVRARRGSHTMSTHTGNCNNRLIPTL